MDIALGLAILLVFFVIYVIFARYTQKVYFKADGQLLAGKTVLITGGESGIGYETVKGLLNMGARVILATCFTDAAQRARQQLTASLGKSDLSDRLVLKYLDLADLSSVRKLADELIREEGRLDVLINNAGALYWEKRVTVDGLENTMAVNYFGHFLLINLLLPLLKKSAPARILVISSCTYWWQKLDFANLNSELYYPGGWQAYARSKLALIYFTVHLARQLEGSGVTVNALHPGVVATGIFRNVPPGLRAFFNWSTSTWFRNAEHGAQTSLFLAASNSADVHTSGKYFVDCEEQSLVKFARDEAVAKKLWDVSERLVGLSESPKM